MNYYLLRRRISMVMLNIVVMTGALLTVSPFVWMLLSSFKNTNEIFRYPPKLLPSPWRLENYENLFTDKPFAAWYINSISVAVCVTLAVLFFSSLAGFAFAKYRFRGRQGLFIILMGSIMIPFQLIIIPEFVLISEMGWTNNYAALIIPFMAPAFGIFLMRQFIESIPSELVDAARIDGASEFGIFLRVVVPLLRPAFGALAIVTFLSSWNSFLWPLIVLRGEEHYTLPVGLATLQSLVAGQQIDYGMAMAAASLVAIPVLAIFLSMQSQFIAGLTAGSIKD